jgi:membrane-bound lytic murein transglycosylase D
MRRFALVLLLTPLAGAQVPYWAEFQKYPHPVELAAQVRQESRFNPLAKSQVGAMGLTQFMPGTWREAIKRGWAPAEASPWDAPASIQAQSGYMTYLTSFFRGSWPKAWAGYNCGEGRVRRVERKVMARGITDTYERRVWLSMLPAETQGYVDRIERVHVPWVRARVGVE